jgi:uncharacterized protein
MLTLDDARRWYPDDPVHGYDHVLRVYRLATRLTEAEGADLEIVQAAVLLHDVDPPGEALPAPVAKRPQHHQAAAEFAGEILRGEGWPEERVAAVQHAIRAHRFRDDTEQPRTLEAMILFDADKLDAIGAIGAARAVAYAAQHDQPAYATPSLRFRQTGQLEPGEKHSAYHEYLFKLSKLKDRLYTASGRLLAEERHRRMSEFFDQLALEMSGES